MRRGDDLCRDFRRELTPKLDRLDTVTDPSEVGDELRPLVDSARRVASGFDKLSREATDGALLRRYAAKSREQTVLFDRAADQFDRGDAERGRRIIDDSQETGAELRGFALGYGFKVCGTPQR